MDKEKLQKKIDENFEEETAFLAKLVSIDSSQSDPLPDAPFGAGVKEAYDAAMQEARDIGFVTSDFDGRGGHAQFGEGEKTLGLPVHLDVVPAGDGWTREPFGAVTEGGRMYGRGTSDDKGPAAACLYAMKALKDIGFEPAMKIRLIFGLDEETGSSGMRHYIDRAGQPDTGWTPDAYFPAIRGEMGNMIFDIACKFPKTAGEGLQLRSVKGGSAPNMVAGTARALLRSADASAYDDIKKLAAERNDAGGRAKLAVRTIGQNLEVTAEGKTAHGSTPWNGVNAITELMSFLGALDISNDGPADVVEFYNRFIGRETDGASLGCRLEDEESGATVLNVGMIYMDMKELRLTVNVRFPVTYEAEDIYEGIMPALMQYDMGVVKKDADDPLYFEKDDPLISGLMDVYAEVTGDTESEPLIMGGGTYAKEFDHVAAFGGLFPGEEDRFHCADEYIELGSLKEMTVIFALAMAKIAGGADAG